MKKRIKKQHPLSFRNYRLSREIGFREWCRELLRAMSLGAKND